MIIKLYHLFKNPLKKQRKVFPWALVKFKNEAKSYTSLYKKQTKIIYHLNIKYKKLNNCNNIKLTHFCCCSCLSALLLLHWQNKIQDNLEEKKRLQ